MKVQFSPRTAAILLLISVLKLTPHLSYAQTADPSQITDLILVTGQSNVRGSQTNYDPTLDAVHDRVFAFTTTRINSTTYSMGGTWQLADLHQAWDIDGWHPGNGSLNDSSRAPYNNFAFHFAKTLADSDPDKVVGIVIASAPGQGIQHWDIGGDLNTAQQLNGVPFDQVINTQATEALAALTNLGAPAAADGFDAILWHQGETDWLYAHSSATSDPDVINLDPNYPTTSPETYYPDKLYALINSYRSSSWFSPNKPFICGETARAPVNQHLMALNSDGNSSTGCVMGNDLPTKDGTHFNDEGLRTLGQRYAEKYLQMSQPLPKTGTIKVMAVGDSITEGYTPDNGTGTPSYRQSFTNVLLQDGCDFEMVGRKTTNYLGNNPQNTYFGYHEGYSGQRANHIRDSLNWDFSTNSSTSGSWSNPGITQMMQDSSPDVVLLHIGTNDLRGQDTASNVASEIHDIIQKIHLVNSSTKVLVANVIPHYPNTPEKSDVNGSIATMANILESKYANPLNPVANVFLADVRTGFTQSYMQSDLIHPNSTGEAHIADAFADVYTSLFPCDSAAIDLIAPETFITTPSTGQTVSDTTLSGYATDTGGSGISNVDIAIRDRNTSQWYNFTDGSFGPISHGGEDVGITGTTLSAPNKDTTNWQFPANNLPAGDYTLFALAADNAGNDAYHGTGQELWPVNIPFQVAATDSVAPSATVTNPSNANDSLSLSPTLTGTITDNAGGSGASRVTIALWSKTLSSFVSLDGIAGPRTVFNATLPEGNPQTADWSLQTALTAGNYIMYAYPYDANGNYKIANRVTAPFSINGSNDTSAPTATITNPATANDTLDLSPTLTGTITDNNGGSGADRVTIALWSKTLTSFVSLNGTASPRTLFNTTLADANQQTSDWSIQTSLPVGKYVVYVYPYDTEGNYDASNRVTRPFAVAGNSDTTAPTASITNPAAANATLGLSPTLSGTITDNTGGSGVDRVTIALWSKTLTSFVSLNGTAGPRTILEATLPAGNPQSANWNLTTNLPAGRYVVYVYPYDVDGNYNSANRVSRSFTVN